MTSPLLQYDIRCPKPNNHLFDIQLTITNWTDLTAPSIAADTGHNSVDLKLPVWTPGSYLVREYAKHLQAFTACDVAGQPLAWQKLSKNHWCISIPTATPTGTAIQIRYQIFAYELTVRTNHLDQSHGFFNPAAVCLYVPNYCDVTHRLTIETPHPDWKIATPLPTVAEQVNTFEASDYDTLVDSPFEIGIQQRYAFEVLNQAHELVVWGQGNLPVQQALQDIRQIIETEAEIFGGLPYSYYLFLLHLSANGYGGLEHKDACTLLFPRLGFREPQQYQRFLQLVAHEFFHLWNVKRIRPKALETFDYDQENYTPSLWFCEGVTSYYDLLIPQRAKLYDTATFLTSISRDITRLQTTPGRQVQPLSESSFDAWIKLYRRDAHSNNTQISYYLKGALVTLLLDTLMRSRSDNQRSFDDVLRLMWQRFGKLEIGFTPADLKATLEEVAGTELTDFYATYIDGLTELPFNDFLQPFGLHVNAIAAQTPDLGLNLTADKTQAIVQSVVADSPAQQAGLVPGDQLLAIDGLRVTTSNLDGRLRDYTPGEPIEVTIFHQDELLTCKVVLAEPQIKQYWITAVESPTAEQRSLFAGWFGEDLEAVHQQLVSLTPAT
ncbi:MAG: M61 family metallopeptidase [Cyanobacteria bacterium P01_H01_bin.121]